MYVYKKGVHLRKIKYQDKTVFYFNLCELLCKLCDVMSAKDATATFDYKAFYSSVTREV